jgi:hypothetical protein
MTEAAVLALLQAVPSIFALFQQMQANGQIKDQATLDAALAAQKSAAEANFSQLEKDLGP